MSDKYDPCVECHAQAACAAMREALVEMRSEFVPNDPTWPCVVLAESALSTDAGAALLERLKRAEVDVDALNRACNESQERERVLAREVEALRKVRDESLLLRWRVHVDGASPDTAVAAFEYLDMAHRWAEAQYPGRYSIRDALAAAEKVPRG